MITFRQKKSVTLTPLNISLRRMSRIRADDFLLFSIKVRMKHGKYGVDWFPIRKDFDIDGVKDCRQWQNEQKKWRVILGLQVSRGWLRDL
jgi:hypothetical protein